MSNEGVNLPWPIKKNEFYKNLKDICMIFK